MGATALQRNRYGPMQSPAYDPPEDKSSNSIASDYKYIGEDYFNRGLYKNIKTGKVYVDVLGELHTKTSSGEPDVPIHVKTPLEQELLAKGYTWYRDEHRWGHTPAYRNREGQHKFIVAGRIMNPADLLYYLRRNWTPVKEEDIRWKQYEMEKEFKSLIESSTPSGHAEKPKSSSPTEYKKPDIFDVDIGDKVGAVDGPGQRPEDNVFAIVEKVKDRWGRHLRIRNEQGREETVHSFTDRGIGWYYLGKPRSNNPISPPERHAFQPALWTTAEIKQTLNEFKSAGGFNIKEDKEAGTVIVTDQAGNVSLQAIKKGSADAWIVRYRKELFEQKSTSPTDDMEEYIKALYGVGDIDVARPWVRRGLSEKDIISLVTKQYRVTPEQVTTILRKLKGQKSSTPMEKKMEWSVSALNALLENYETDPHYGNITEEGYIKLMRDAETVARNRGHHEVMREDLAEVAYLKPMVGEKSTSPMEKAVQGEIKYGEEKIVKGYRVRLHADDCECKACIEARKVSREMRTVFGKQESTTSEKGSSPSGNPVKSFSRGNIYMFRGKSGEVKKGRWTGNIVKWVGPTGILELVDLDDPSIKYQVPDHLIISELKEQSPLSEGTGNPQNPKYKVDIIDKNRRIVRKGKDLDTWEAIRIAFPEGYYPEGTRFGVMASGNDLVVRKIEQSPSGTQKPQKYKVLFRKVGEVADIYDDGSVEFYVNNNLVETKKFSDKEQAIKTLISQQWHPIIEGRSERAGKPRADWEDVGYGQGYIIKRNIETGEERVFNAYSGGDITKEMSVKSAKQMGGYKPAPPSQSGNPISQYDHYRKMVEESTSSTWLEQVREYAINDYRLKRITSDQLNSLKYMINEKIKQLSSRVEKPRSKEETFWQMKREIKEAHDAWFSRRDLKGAEEHVSHCGSLAATLKLDEINEFWKDYPAYKKMYDDVYHALETYHPGWKQGAQHSGDSDLRVWWEKLPINERRRVLESIGWSPEDARNYANRTFEQLPYHIKEDIRKRRQKPESLLGEMLQPPELWFMRFPERIVASVRGVHYDIPVIAFYRDRRPSFSVKPPEGMSEEDTRQAIGIFISYGEDLEKLAKDLRKVGFMELKQTALFESSDQVIAELPRPAVQPTIIQENPASKYPMPGDLVRVTDTDDVLIKIGSYGVIEGTEGKRKDEYEVTFNPSPLPWWDKGHITSSGGPSRYVKANLIRPSDEKKKQLFQYFPGLPGAGQARTVEKEVNVFTVNLKETARSGEPRIYDIEPVDYDPQTGMSIFEVRNVTDETRPVMLFRGQLADCQGWIAKNLQYPKWLMKERERHASVPPTKEQMAKDIATEYGGVYADIMKLSEKTVKRMYEEMLYRTGVHVREGKSTAVAEEPKEKPLTPEQDALLTYMSEEGIGAISFKGKDRFRLDIQKDLELAKEMVKQFKIPVPYRRRKLPYGYSRRWVRWE